MSALVEGLTPNPMTIGDSPAQPIHDDELADRARAGDLAAFNALVERYQRSVFGLCVRMLSSAPAAEDAAQETFISAWKGLTGYRGGSFQAWILRIAGNECRDELRRRKRRPTDSLDDLVEKEGDAVIRPAAGRTPEEHSLGSETAAAIRDGLATLPEDQRMAVLLSDVHGLAYDEVAKTMDTSIGTVKSRISRGRARLRDYLRARGELPSGIHRLAQQDAGAGTSPARSQP